MCAFALTRALTHILQPGQIRKNYVMVEIEREREDEVVNDIHLQRINARRTEIFREGSTQTRIRQYRKCI